MKIIDINGKEREALSVKKMVHSTVDAVTKEPVEEVFLEVIIQGKNRVWVEWWPEAEYKKFNPGKKPHWKK